MKQLASLSLDLDNQWSYMKVHNDPGWEAFPSYLDRVVPSVLNILDDLDLSLTFFVVGQDAALDANLDAMAQIGTSRHEVGCHSFQHEPWLHLYSAAEVDEELARAEDAIQHSTGRQPNGFRGPGFSLSATVLDTLVKRGYLYDASTLPTFMGPLARAYYFMTARLGDRERDERKALFGTVRDGLRPVTPYRWHLSGGSLLEIPVTTVPVAKVPFHLSYVLYLGTFSFQLARRYFQGALAACRASGVEPSILLHPLDFLGGDEVPELAFFPAMNLSGDVKRERMRTHLDDLGHAFDVVPMGVHADALSGRNLPLRNPDFHLPEVS
jgi:peptidoglycan/xylan/chitin deacetylase (PgdA/CDA1 family)